MTSHDEDLEEKKLLGSGGHLYAKLTDKKKSKLVLECLIFSSRYYCKACKREYTGSPVIHYENPNEDYQAKGLILVEKGEYLCGVCNNTLAIYRKFK
jgi:hypothetical protein